MSQHEAGDNNPRVGYLRSCIDYRFLAATRHKFEEVTRLGESEYYHEAFAGGTLGIPPAVDGAHYVYQRSFEIGRDIDLIFMGWQVHLNKCGGLPGQTDPQIIQEFEGQMKSIRELYPLVKNHVFLLAFLRDNQPYVEVRV